MPKTKAVMSAEDYKYKVERAANTLIEYGQVWKDKKLLKAARAKLKEAEQAIK